MAGDFFDRDSHHGLAKRIILYRYLQAQVGRSLNNSQKNGDYDITYLDGFSGPGIYGSNEDHGNGYGVELNDNRCPFRENFGSPLVALEALFKHVTEKKVNGPRKTLFVFIETNQDRYNQLQQNVIKYIQERNLLFNRNQADIYTIQCSFNIIGHTNIIEVQIKFHHCNFENFNDESVRLNKPMVTFLDPLRFKNTPMDIVVNYIGDRKSIIFNFMVRDIHKYGTLAENRERADLLFGDKEWRKTLPKKDFSKLTQAQIMEKYAICYRDHLKKRYNVKTDDCIRFLKFSLRKGSNQDPETHFIYYMLFAAVDLTSIANVKYALHTVAQNFKLPEKPTTTTDELYFTDFYVHSEIPWRPKKAKDLKREEAKFIFDHYRGQEVKFGELKEWVIMETPYQFHSRALQFLEKESNLTVVSTNYERFPNVTKYERERKAFPSNIGIYNNDKDWDTCLKIKYCNDWLLKFGD